MAETSSSQASDYTLDVLYPSRFLTGQAPLQMQFVAAAGSGATSGLKQSFRYLDLGCGNGNTVNLLAASYPQAEFFGIDINDAHIAFGQDRGKRAGLDNVSFINASFAELGALELPAFDYICLCGAYSWISPVLQQAINVFVQKQLLPGGLYGVHYSSLPGQAVSDPLVEYLRALCETRSGSSVERFQRGLEDLRKLAPVARFFNVNPRAAELVGFFTKSPPDAMAHEVLNRQMHSFHCAEVHEALANVGLEFRGSAGMLPNYPELLMSGPAYAVYRELTNGRDMLLKETTKDLLLNTSRRFDLFRKPDTEHGRNSLAGGLAELGSLYLRRARKGDLEARRRASAHCANDLTETIYSTVLDLAETPVIALAEALESEHLSRFPGADIEKAIERLFVTGFLHLLLRPPVRSEFRPDRLYRLTSKLNAIQLEESALSTRAEDLASPVLGSPVRMSQAGRLGLLALTGSDLDRVWDALERQQQLKPADDGGRPITTRAQFRAQIEQSLPRFAAETLPDLLWTGIVEAT